MHVISAHARLVGIILFFYFSLLVKSIEDEMQPSNDCVNTARGWTLEKLQAFLESMFLLLER